MTRFARLVQIVRSVPELVRIPSLDDIEDLEADIPKRLDPSIPFDWIPLDFRHDLRRRQLDRVRTRAVVLVAGRRERPPNLQQVRAFGHCDAADADLLPVLLGFGTDVL